jgi:hypothetical protein
MKLPKKLLKMSMDELKVFIKENDETFKKHIPAHQHEEYINNILHNALFDHALNIVNKK